MVQLISDISTYRCTHYREPGQLMVSPQDWDLLVATSYHYPVDAKWPWQKVWHNPATGPDHGTICGIPARKDASVSPGRVRLRGGQR